MSYCNLRLDYVSLLVEFQVYTNIYMKQQISKKTISIKI